MTALAPSSSAETPLEDAAPGHEDWRAVGERFRRTNDRLPSPWEDIFGPLRTGKRDGLVVVGQVGQSLDGRIATTTGRSCYINGAAGLAHLHRLRALVDAVVIGVGCALADDPQLTVRHVRGRDPARVVIDPRGRLAPTARVLAEDGVRRVVVTGQGALAQCPGAEIVVLPAEDGRIEPAAVLASLAERGMRRILVEGGPETLSRFLAARCVDRLHVIVAPIILGDGRPGFSLGPIDRVEQALSPPMRVHRLDDEVLFDCDLSAQRAPIGEAKKST